MRVEPRFQTIRNRFSSLTRSDDKIIHIIRDIVFYFLICLSLIFFFSLGFIIGQESTPESIYYPIYSVVIIYTIFSTAPRIWAHFHGMYDDPSPIQMYLPNAVMFIFGQVSGWILNWVRTSF